MRRRLPPILSFLDDAASIFILLCLFMVTINLGMSQNHAQPWLQEKVEQNTSDIDSLRLNMEHRVTGLETSLVDVNKKLDNLSSQLWYIIAALMGLGGEAGIRVVRKIAGNGYTKGDKDGD